MQDFKLYRTLTILADMVAGFVSISAFSSLVCIDAGILSSAVEIKIGTKTVIIKKY